MKKIDLLVIKNFLGPFILTTLVVVFIFLMRFLMLYFEDFVGKDLGLDIFAKLFFYFSIITVPIALPLSTLLAALMSYGNLGEHTELTALKSAGIPVSRIIRPSFIFTIFIAIFSFWYNNTVTPWANLKGYSLLYDIKTTKVTLNITEGIFYREIPGYSIKVQEKMPDNISLKNVIVYDHSNRNGNKNVTLADSGKMYAMYDDRYLIFELFNGVNYSEQKADGGAYNDTPLVKNRFIKNKMVFSLESFGIKRTDENQFKYHEYMKNIAELEVQIDSTKKLALSSLKTNLDVVKNQHMYQFKPSNNKIEVDTASGDTLKKKILPGKWIDSAIRKLDQSYRKMEIADVVSTNLESLTAQVSTNSLIYSSKKREMYRADVEKWHKFTYAVACIAMMLIGASLGSIIKKGGFGMPVVIAVSFFIFYYVLMQLGDKYAKEGIITVLAGTWMPNGVLLIIGTYLLSKATKDARLFEGNIMLKLILKFKSIFKKNSMANS